MNLIAAVDQNWGIGFEGTQPIVIPEDREYFKLLTKGCTIIVGRKTLEDFPGKKPLPGRQNLVFSRNRSLSVEGAIIVHTLKELFEVTKDTDPDRIFVLGGESLFRLLLPYCRYAYITKIRAVAWADTYLPNLDKMQNWYLEHKGEVHSHDGIEFSFDRYENRNLLKCSVYASF